MNPKGRCAEFKIRNMSQLRQRSGPKIRNERVMAVSEGRRYCTRSVTRFEPNKNHIQLIYGHIPILKNILSYLDYKSLLACRLVFKPWLEGITGVVFSRSENVLHLDRFVSICYDIENIIMDRTKKLGCFIGISNHKPRSASDLMKFVRNKKNANFISTLFQTFELEGFPLRHQLLTKCTPYLTRLCMKLHSEEIRMTDRYDYRFDNLQYLKLDICYCRHFMVVPDENWNWDLPQLNTLVLAGSSVRENNIANGHAKVIKMLSNNENIKHIEILQNESLFVKWSSNGGISLNAIVSTPAFQKGKLEAITLSCPVTLGELTGLLTPKTDTVCALKTIDVQLNISEVLTEPPILNVFEQYASSLQKLCLLKRKNTKIGVTFPLLPNVKELYLKSGQKEFRNLNFLNSFPCLEKLHISGRRNESSNKSEDMGFNSILDGECSLKESKIKCLRFCLIEDCNFNFLLSLQHLVYVSFNTDFGIQICEQLILKLQHCKGLRVLKLVMSFAYFDGKPILTGIPNDRSRPNDDDDDDDEQPSLPYIGLLHQVTHLDLHDWKGCCYGTLSTRIVRVLCQTMNLKFLRLHSLTIVASTLDSFRDAGIRVESWECEQDNGYCLLEATRRLGNFWKVRDDNRFRRGYTRITSDMHLPETLPEDWWNTV